MNRYEIELEESAKKYIKKVKDIKLKEMIINKIYDNIAINPYNGEKKKGILKECWTESIRCKSCDYRIAYFIKNRNVSIVLCGPHENFYNKLIRLMKHK